MEVHLKFTSVEEVVGDEKNEERGGHDKGNGLKTESNLSLFYSACSLLVSLPKRSSSCLVLMFH